jgi:hypothetical protein
MAKYDALRDYLADLPSGQRRVTLSFKRIEELLGEALPPSATRYHAWWIGGRPDRPDRGRGRSPQENWQDQVQTRAWESVGWTVDELDLVLRTVTFRRR